MERREEGRIQIKKNCGSAMKISGLQKFSLIDYPGKTCATVFTQGCNFKCPFCHNKQLIATDKQAELKTIDVINFLRKKENLLQAVCISGGEPTIQSNLIDFIRVIKSRGFLIKIDTNGSRPDIIKELIETSLVDFFAMDIKAPKEKYELLTGTDCDYDVIDQSMRLIKNSGAGLQFRTTFVEPLLTKDDMSYIKSIAGEGHKTQEYISVQ